ncbi:MAG: MBL fold metallo-hydrolase [Myxococcota bacterium]|nr:MBL fold metallo-hydrolase [Myxococcota bacterium]
MYIAFAQAKEMRIAYVFETHVHADHRSGGRALAEKSGAKYALHRNADVGFAFEPLDDNQVIEMGNTIIRVLHTPGHTPESIALVVSDLRRGPEPWFVCTGDTLFVGSVGRPDLPGHERDNAAELHRSLHEKLLGLPDALEVYPAHFSGSPCGAGLSGKPSSTIGFEKQWNPVLGLEREAFVDEVGGSAPAKPVGMDEVLRFNQGRA